MQFCKDCGGVLNIFGKNTSGLCSSCIQHKKEPEQLTPVTEPAKPATANENLLAKAKLTVENGKIILRSQEGWQLWSAPQNTQTELHTLLKSAKLIYEIRKKSKKSKKIK